MPNLFDEVRANFLRLDGATSPSLAMEHLVSSALTYGVIVQPDGSPASLTIREDLEAARQAGARSLLGSPAVLPPVILAPEGITAEELAGHPAVVALNYGARGAILLRQHEARAVLPAKLILAALGVGHWLAVNGPLSGGLFDPNLAGETDTERIRGFCRVCGYPYDLPSYDPEYPPMCENPSPPRHRLKL